MTCTFCGGDFDPIAARRECQACFRVSRCAGFRCPRCGYEMPEEIQLLGRLTEWWRRVWSRGREVRITGARLTLVRPAPARQVELAGTAVPLADMKPGESGVVVELRPERPGHMEKCLALGILPGVAVTLRRNSPSYVFDLGFSQFAVDHGMAHSVLVQRHAE